MSKRRFSDAFPTFATAFGAANSIYNAFKRPRTSGSYTLFPNGNGANMARSRFRVQRRQRYGTRTKRRRSFRRGTTRKRIRRIWTFMRNKGLRNIETKYNYNTFTSGSALGANRVTLLSDAGGAGITAKGTFTNIPQGTTAYERIGQKVFIKALKLRWYLQAPPVGVAGVPVVPQENHIRIVVVREKEALGATDAEITPKIYHVYQNNLSSGSSDPNLVVAGDSRLQFISLFKYYNSKFADNYTVLMDRTYKVANENGGDRYYIMKRMNIRVNQPCHWDAAGRRGDGHIYFFYFTDITSTPETAGFIPLLWCSFRVTYTDC